MPFLGKNLIQIFETVIFFTSIFKLAYLSAKISVWVGMIDFTEAGHFPIKEN